MADKPAPKPGQPIGHPIGKATSEHHGSDFQLIDIIDKVDDIKTAIDNKEPLTAWEHTLEVQKFLIDTGRGFGFKSEDDEDKDAAKERKKQIKELEKKLKQCATAANKLKVSKTKASASAELQKFGDGVLLGKLLDLLVKLLPILL